MRKKLIAVTLLTLAAMPAFADTYNPWPGGCGPNMSCSCSVPNDYGFHWNMQGVGTLGGAMILRVMMCFL